MLKDNLVALRNFHGFSQEQIAEKINISRQAYAKWENGATVPDIEKCLLLSEVYGVTVDSLVKSQATDEGLSFSTPKGKNIWGSVTVNDRGQFVIPKGARNNFNIIGGTRLIVLSDDNGIALIPAERFEENLRKVMELASKKNEEN